MEKLMYRIDHYAGSPRPYIVEVEVVKETPKFVTTRRYINFQSERGVEARAWDTKSRRESRDYTYYETFDEARAALIDLYDRRIRVKEELLEGMKRERETVCFTTEPKEDK